jgi:hypothetical protein
MADKRISELTTIVTVDNATDLLPIVDTSAGETKKITPTALKSALSLDAVNNTSDANKPISSAMQTALDLKVDENAAITGATKTKITYDAKGLVTSGADATTADIADSTNKRYVTDAQATVIGNTSGTNTGDNATNTQYSGLAASKQDVLGFTPENVANKSTTLDTDQASDTKYPSVKAVYDWAVGLFQAKLISGTNIKTINSTSLLGSGNLSISASPSGVAGAIQFSDGSAFSSDATNFFWDNTNKRLGLGTNSPASLLSLSQTIALAAGATNPRIANIAYTINNTGAQTGTTTGIFLNTTLTALNGQTHNFIDIQNGGGSIFKLSVGLLDMFADCQINAGGVFKFKTRSQIFSTADGDVSLSNNIQNSFNKLNLGLASVGFPAIKRNGAAIDFRLADDSAFCNISALGGYFNTSSIQASAILQADSTTKGFLPPRMTTTQKDAISSPASGLVVYDTTLGKLCVRGASAWETLTSV